MVFRQGPGLFFCRGRRQAFHFSTWTTWNAVKYAHFQIIPFGQIFLSWKNLHFWSQDEKKPPRGVDRVDTFWRIFSDNILLIRCLQKNTGEIVKRSAFHFWPRGLWMPYECSAEQLEQFGTPGTPSSGHRFTQFILKMPLFTFICASVPRNSGTVWNSWG